MMKKLFYTAFFLLFSFPIFSFAQSLSGMYEREKDFMGNPTVLIFKDGGKFEISTGGTSIRGTYTIADGNLSFRDETGDYADTLAGLGVFTTVLKDGKLIFKAVKYKAIQRKDVLTGSNWKQMKN